MTSGGSNFNDFPENQFTKFRAVLTIKANRDHGVGPPIPRVDVESKIFQFCCHCCEYQQFKH